MLLLVLPENNGMAFVVTHLSHTYKRMMSELLSKATRILVRRSVGKHESSRTASL